MKIELDTPKNILELSEKEVIDLCVEGEDINIPMDKRFMIAKHLFKAMKLDLTSDIALAIMSNPTHKLIIAGAGAGKSTVMHASILISKAMYSLTKGKILPGNRILFLAFNENNVIDMKSTHEILASNIAKSGIKGAKIDDRIDARTFHSFCMSWFQEYQEYLGYRDAYLETDDNVFVDRLERLLPMVRRKFEVKEDVNIKEMLNLYRNAQESMIPFDSERIYDLYPNLPCSLEALKGWFVAFSSVKRSLGKFDFTDIVVGFNKLTRENEAFLDRMSINFHEINLDECQDFNPIMIDSIKNLSKKMKVTLIGDEDQLIYRFRGADPEMLVGFKEDFEGGKVYSMLFNRRCRAKICETALDIVKRNTKRFDKVVLPMRPGGDIILKGYATEEGQLFQLINHLKSKPVEDLSKVAVACKENAHTFMLTHLMEENGILFHVKRGNNAYSHRIYDHYVNLLSLLESPFDPYLKRELYKVLPISRTELATVLEDDNGDLNFEVARKHFGEIDYGSLETKYGFRESLKNLETMSNMARKEPVRNYIVGLTNMFYSYYWNYMLKLSEGDEKHFKIDKFFTEAAFDYFNSPLMVRPLLLNLSRRRDVLESYNKSEIGVAVGTLHSFKGLEAEEFHMTYMDSNVFPNIEVHGNLSEDAIKGLYEAENSLAYVGMTRAKEKLYMHYNLESPSVYVLQAKEFLTNYEEKEIFIPKFGEIQKPSSEKPLVSKPKDSEQKDREVVGLPGEIEEAIIKDETRIPEKVEGVDLDLDFGQEQHLPEESAVVTKIESFEETNTKPTTPEDMNEREEKVSGNQERVEEVNKTNKDEGNSKENDTESNDIELKPKSKVSSFLNTFKI